MQEYKSDLNKLSHIGHPSIDYASLDNKCLQAIIERLNLDAFKKFFQ